MAGDEIENRRIPIASIGRKQPECNCQQSGNCTDPVKVTGQHSILRTESHHCEQIKRAAIGRDAGRGTNPRRQRRCGIQILIGVTRVPRGPDPDQDQPDEVGRSNNDVYGTPDHLLLRLPSEEPKSKDCSAAGREGTELVTSLAENSIEADPFPLNAAKERRYNIAGIRTHKNSTPRS